MRTGSPSISTSFRRLGKRCALSLLALLLAGLTAETLPAQTPPAVQPANKVQSPAPHHRAHRTLKKTPKTEAKAEVTPPAPPAPNWPINDSPVPASVNWDGGSLRIIAANSSLKQILDDVARETGAKVEGAVKDQRVFGDFGPGLPGDVLSQLLHGTGYNFMLVGDAGRGMPREVILSAASTAAPGMRPASTSPQQDDYDESAPDNQYDAPPQPPMLPQPQPPNAGPEGQQPVRTPQEILREMQMRQQQMQQQNTPQD